MSSAADYFMRPERLDFDHKSGRAIFGYKNSNYQLVVAMVGLPRNFFWSQGWGDCYTAPNMFSPIHGYGRLDEIITQALHQGW